MRLTGCAVKACWLLAAADIWSACAAGPVRPNSTAAVAYSRASSRALLSARRRKLFSFNIQDILESLGVIGKKSSDFAKDAADELSNAAGATLQLVQGTFNKASGLISSAVTESEKLLEAIVEFGSTMLSIYEDFLPLQPIFESQNGVIALVTSKERLRILVDVVLRLFETSDTVYLISEAAGLLAEIFAKIYDVFDAQLSSLSFPGGRRLLSVPGVDFSQLLGGGRRLLSVPGVDFSQLLGGLNFDYLNRTFADIANKVSDALDSLSTVRAALEPLLQKLDNALAARRLWVLEESTAPKSILPDVRADHEKYAGAITQIIPTWQELEREVIRACEVTDVAVGQVSSLQCRSQGFLAFSSIPSSGDISSLVDSCDEKASDNSDASCPEVAHSESIRDTLGDSAFFIGVVCVTVEYLITYSGLTRVIFALFLFATPGIWLWAAGYRYKNVEFWIEGFFGGLVMWSAILSVLLIWIGACTPEGFIFCDWKWMVAAVLVLSLIWAYVVVKGARCQLFFAGFDLGAVLGAIGYLVYDYQAVVDSVLDPQMAKKQMLLFLTAAIMAGGLAGTLTLYFAKVSIVMATAAIGAAMLQVAFYIVAPLIGLQHKLGWWDLVLFLLLTAVGIAVQYRFTNPPEGEEDFPDGEGGWIDQPADKQQFHMASDKQPLFQKAAEEDKAQRNCGRNCGRSVC